MAGAMHKMAVYLGLVEDDPHYDDGYDPYDEYDEFEDAAETPEPEADRPVPRGSRADFAVEPSAPASRGAAAPPPRPRMPPISRASPPCTHARTMKPVPSESTSVRALR